MTRLSAIVVVASFALTLWGAATSTLPSVPACPEDAVLVGVGTFEDGRWSEYVCGPAVDDYWVEAVPL